MPNLLPLPPSNVPFIDIRTGGVSLEWSNYLLTLESAVGTGFAPLDAQYWVSTANSTLTNERNIGALSSGYVYSTQAAGIATPSTVSAIPAADISGVLDVEHGGTGADLSGTGGPSQVLQQASAGGDVTVGQLALSDIAGAGSSTTAYGAGTAYSFTNTAAAIDFGTTDPSITLTTAGTYLLFAQVLLAYNAATVVAETATVKMRRTNNTPADVGQVVVIDLPVATTLTYSYGVVQLPVERYTTANTTDTVTLFGNVSAALGAGTIDATAVGTSIVALRIL